MERNEEIYIKKIESDLSGHNEAEQDLDIEIRVGEWHDLKKKKKPVVAVVPQGMTFLATYSAVSFKLSVLVREYYDFSHSDYAHAQEVLVTLRKLWEAQEVLLKHLLAEPEVQFKREVLTAEVWSLIE